MSSRKNFISLSIGTLTGDLPSMVTKAAGERLGEAWSFQHGVALVQEITRFAPLWLMVSAGAGPAGATVTVAAQVLELPAASVAVRVITLAPAGTLMPVSTH